MKGVIIKNMQMPENCGECPFRWKSEWGWEYCRASYPHGITLSRNENRVPVVWHTRHPECPLIETEVEDEDLEMQIKRSSSQAGADQGDI